MKKVMTVLLALLVATAAFGVEAEFSGDTSMTWGMDFDHHNYSVDSGFENSTDVTITFPFADFGSENQEGDGMYGSIEISDFGLKIDDSDGATIQGDDFGVAAKVYFTEEVSWQIAGAPGMGYNYADRGYGGNDVQTNYIGDAYSNVAGTAFGFANDMISFNLKAASVGNQEATQDEVDEVDDKYTTPTMGVDNEDGQDAQAANVDSARYMIAGDFGVALEDDLFTMDVYGVADLNTMGVGTHYITMGAKPAVSASGVTATLGTDVFLAPDGYVNAANPAEKGTDAATYADFTFDLGYDIEDDTSVSMGLVSGMSTRGSSTSMPGLGEIAATKDFENAQKAVYATALASLDPEAVQDYAIVNGIKIEAAEKALAEDEVTTEAILDEIKDSSTTYATAAAMIDELGEGKDVAMSLPMDISLNFSEDGGLVEGLGVEFDVALNDLMSTQGSLKKEMNALYKAADLDEPYTESGLNWAVDLDLAYEAVDGLTPGMAVGYGTDDGKLNMGVDMELAEALTTIDNTTFTVAYTSDNVAEMEYTPAYSAAKKTAAQDPGVVTVSAKVSY